MALRPQIIGIDLAKLRSIFGSKDEEVLEGLLAKYDDEIHDDYLGEMEQDKEARQLISDLVNGEIDPSEAEGKPLFTNLLTSLFVYYDQDVVWTESNLWKKYFVSYFSDLQPFLAGDGKKLISYFLKGRPLFGDKVAPTKTNMYYCYLTQDEVVKLSEVIERNKELFYDKEGFGQDFHGWIEKIKSSGKDLFFYS